MGDKNSAVAITHPPLPKLLISPKQSATANSLPAKHSACLALCGGGGKKQKKGLLSPPTWQTCRSEEDMASREMRVHHTL